MSISAKILHLNLNPVFADFDDRNFFSHGIFINLDQAQLFADDSLDFLLRLHLSSKKSPKESKTKIPQAAKRKAKKAVETQRFQLPFLNGRWGN